MAKGKREVTGTKVKAVECKDFYCSVLWTISWRKKRGEKWEAADYQKEGGFQFMRYLMHCEYNGNLYGKNELHLNQASGPEKQGSKWAFKLISIGKPICMGERMVPDGVSHYVSCFTHEFSVLKLRIWKRMKTIKHKVDSTGSWNRVPNNEAEHQHLYLYTSVRRQRNEMEELLCLAVSEDTVLQGTLK